MKKKEFTSELIAPCGINCGVCYAFLREKNKCIGCRGSNANKPITRIKCKIKTCRVFKNGKSKFCFQCRSFPCENLKHLDNRYKDNYGMSVIENLEGIKNKGMGNFLKNQEKKWVCKKGIICVHNKKVYSN